jgi:hypothetical protein
MHVRIKLSNPSAYLSKLFKHEKHPTFASVAALLIMPDAGLPPLPSSRALDAASNRAPAAAPFHVREQATSTKNETYWDSTQSRPGSAHYHVTMWPQFQLLCTNRYNANSKQLTTTSPVVQLLFANPLVPGSNLRRSTFLRKYN